MKMLALALAAGAVVAVELSKPRGGAYGQEDLFKDIVGALEANKPSTFGDKKFTDEEKTWCGSLPSEESILKSMLDEAGPFRGYPPIFCAAKPNDARCLALKSRDTCIREDGDEFIDKNFRPLGETVGRLLKDALGGAFSSVFGSVLWIVVGAGVVYLVVHR
jgi:hypothetical protein